MRKSMLLSRYNIFLSFGLAVIFCADSRTILCQEQDRFAEYLLRKDENHNGVLDPEEWQNSRSRYMIENAAKEAGIDLNQPLPITKLQQAFATQREKMGGGSPFGGGFGPPGGGFGPPGGGFGPPGGGYGPPGSSWGRPPEQSSSSSSSSSSGDSSKSSDSRKSESRSDKKSSLPPGVPGFGEKIDLKPVLGFGSALDTTQLAAAPPLTKEEERAREKEREREREREKKESRDSSRDDRSSSSSSSRDSGSSSRDREDYERREREKNRDTAKSMVSQYDTNKDGVLTKRDDEWKSLRGSPENADYNKDGIITVDELTERLMERSRESYSSSRSSYGGYGSKPPVGTNGKPVRFLTATERLPEGLPTWFTRGDLNGDGQVSMAEYATKWDDAKIAEFARYDVNSDGMITALECIAAEKSRSSSSSSRTASTFSTPPAGDKPTAATSSETKPAEAVKPSEKPSE